MIRIFFLFVSLFSHLNAVSPLIVGMELSYPPFETIDKKGYPTGISVDIAEALGEYLKRPVVIQNIPYVGLIPALKTGKVDIVISSLSITKERAQAIDYSDPYVTIGLAMLIQKDSSIKNFYDLDQKGNKVVVKMGTIPQLYVLNNVKKASVIILDKETSAVMEVVQGKADAFIYDQISIYNHWQKNKETTSALLESLKKECWAIGVRKGNEELRQKINAFLKVFKQEGGFDRLNDKYLKGYKEAFEKMGIPFYFDNESC